LTHFVIARLKSDVTLDQTQAQLTGISQRLERQYPRSNRNRSVVVTRLRDDMIGDIRPTLVILLGAVELVLVIACSNIATLLLARATSRTREIAMRAALGASRGRIVRQLLTESLFLALLAGLIGSVAAFSGSKALVALAPVDIPRLAEVRVDAHVLIFTLVISGVASLLFGMVPAVWGSRVDLNEAIKQGGARTMMSGRTGRLRQALVVGEIALSVMLLTGAGLLIRSFVALNSVELGFRPEQVLVMETSVPFRSAVAARFFSELVAEISRIPGVQAAGATMGIPGHVESAGSYWIDHLPEAVTISPFDAVFSVVAAAI
jgi:predicted permease